MTALIEVKDLTKHFPIKRGVLLQRQVTPWTRSVA